MMLYQEMRMFCCYTADIEREKRERDRQTDRRNKEILSLYIKKRVKIPVVVILVVVARVVYQ